MKGYIKYVAFFLLKFANPLFLFIFGLNKNKYVSIHYVEYKRNNNGELL